MEHITELAAVGRQITAHYEGYPQDIDGAGRRALYV